MSMATPLLSWVPDWKCKDQYPDINSTPRALWAWQFLRRNPEYQRDWRNAQNDLLQSHDKGPFQQETALDRHFQLLWLGGKWGLACHAPDPAILSPEVLLFNTPSTIGVVTREDVEKYGEIPLSPRTWSDVLLTCNINLPVDTLVEQIRGRLTSVQNHFLEEGKIRKQDRRVPSDEILLRYLRCFDAASSGVSKKEIAATLLPGEVNEYPDYVGSKKVADSLRAANKLIHGGYKSWVIRTEK